MLTSKCSEVGCDAALPPAGEKFKNIIIIQEKSGLQDLDYTECVNEYFYFILFIKVIIYFFFIVPLSVCVGTRVVFSRSPPPFIKV